MASLKPMLLTAATVLPTGPGVAFEPKIDGMRALVEVTASSVRLMSRHSKDWTASFPELADLTRLGISATFDGELAVHDADGRADFDLLGRRLVARAAIPTLAATTPARLYVFDLIVLAGRDLCDQPWTERRRILDDVDLDRAGEVVRRVPYTFDGDVMHNLTAELRYEGTVAKRCRSHYLPNRRTRAWVKVKHRRSAWFDVMGWRPPTSQEPGGLLVAENGTPVGMAMLFVSKQDEARLLEMMRRQGRPRHGTLAVPDGCLEAEVGFTERTARGTLREAVCRSIRPVARQPA